MRRNNQLRNAARGRVGHRRPSRHDPAQLRRGSGERVSVTLANQGGTLFNPAWRILRPDGVTVCGFAFAGLNDCLLATAGSYAVEVVDSSLDGSGTYGLHIQRLTAGQRCGGTIARHADEQHAGNDEHRGHEPPQLRRGSGGTRVGDPRQSGRHVVQPGVADPQAGQSRGVRVCVRRAQRLPAGDGRVVPVEVVDGSLDGSGTYGLHIQRLTAGQRCGDTIACGTPMSSTLGTTNTADTNLHSFTAVAGERVSVTLANQGGTSFSPAWRILRPDGVAVCGFAFAGLNDCLLATAGSYTVEVVDGSVDGSGTYGLHIQRLTAGQRCGDTIPCGTPISRTLGTTNIADTNLHSFNAVAGERVSVALANQGGTLFNPAWRIVGPDGVAVCGFAFIGLTDCTLPTAGSYAVEVVDSSTDGSGTYGLHIQRLTAGQRCGDTIACGTPVEDSLGAVSRADANLHSLGLTTGTIDVMFTNLGGTSESVMEIDSAHWSASDQLRFVRLRQPHLHDRPWRLVCRPRCRRQPRRQRQLSGERLRVGLPIVRPGHLHLERSGQDMRRERHHRQAEDGEHRSGRIRADADEAVSLGEQRAGRRRHSARSRHSHRRSDIRRLEA